MTTQHDGLPVLGYRPQSEDAVSLVNRNKEIEEYVLRALDDLAKNRGIDPRWYAVGRRHIEQGFMEINRAVFQPQRVKLRDAMTTAKDVFMAGYAHGMDCDRDAPFKRQAEVAWETERMQVGL